MRNFIFAVAFASELFGVAAQAQTQPNLQSPPPWWNTQIAVAKDIIQAKDPNRLLTLSPEQKKSLFDLELQVGSCLSKTAQKKTWAYDEKSKEVVRKCLAEEWITSDDNLRLVLSIPEFSELHKFILKYDVRFQQDAYYILDCPNPNLSMNLCRENKCNNLWNEVKYLLKPTQRCRCCD